MKLESHHFDRRCEGLRVPHPGRQRRLPFLAKSGQQVPIVVVAADSQADRYVVIDGYKRITAQQQIVPEHGGGPWCAATGYGCSLAYFLPVIEEALERVCPDYFQYLRQRLRRIAPNR